MQNCVELFDWFVVHIHGTIVNKLLADEPLSGRFDMVLSLSFCHFWEECAQNCPHASAAEPRNMGANQMEPNEMHIGSILAAFWLPVSAVKLLQALAPLCWLHWLHNGSIFAS